jgi:hypothetical protein
MEEALACAQRLAAHLAGGAGGKLLAVYLHGSAVLGGWVPGRSDVDVLIVVADDTGDATADSMAQAIVVAGSQCPAPGLESSIVAAATARYPASPWPYLRHVVAGPVAAPHVVVPNEAAPGDRDLLMHYAVCRAAGHPVLGPSPRELIGPIPRPDVLAYLADELSWGLANAAERYAVLNACRALAYLADGTIVAKIAGGETALRDGSGPAGIITRALAQQRGEQADQPPAEDATEFVLSIAARLRAGS